MPPSFNKFILPVQYLIVNRLSIIVLTLRPYFIHYELNIFSQYKMSSPLFLIFLRTGRTGNQTSQGIVTLYLPLLNFWPLLWKFHKTLQNEAIFTLITKNALIFASISLITDISLRNITNWWHFCHCQNQNNTSFQCHSLYTELKTAETITRHWVLSLITVIKEVW